jgi:hypothetical protein
MIFDNPFFTEMLLPFLLVFVVVFAILQKSKVLGEGKTQIDAIVALVIGLILIGVPAPRDIIVGIMPWMAVGVAVILVFFILYGFVAGDLSNVPKWMKITGAALAGVFTVSVVLYVAGLWGDISNWFSSGSEVWVNVVMIVMILAVVAVAVFGGKKKD